MKKKVLTVILPLCVAMAMTACGENADTTEVEETTEIAESTEADAQAKVEAEDSTVDEKTVESEQSEGEESFEEVETSVDEQEYPSIDDYVLEQDKSDEYGVYSKSCFDLDQFLDENGCIQEEWYYDWESKEHNEYSGRFAYPEFTPCELFTELAITGRTDYSEFLYGYNSETNSDVYIAVCSGLNNYSFTHDDIGFVYPNEDMGTKEVMFTAQTYDGEVDVISYYLKTTSGSYTIYDEDGNVVEEGEGVSEKQTTYYYDFCVGNFSVSLTSFDVELTQDDVQLIIDNIRLTNGIEQ